MPASLSCSKEVYSKVLLLSEGNRACLAASKIMWKCCS